MIRAAISIIVGLILAASPIAAAYVATHRHAPSGTSANPFDAGH